MALINLADVSVTDNELDEKIKLLDKWKADMLLLMFAACLC